MPGPLPKPTAQRRRRNTTAGTRSLRQSDAPVVPKLPFKVTDPTAYWWVDVWASPMAAEYAPSDVHGLFLLADLVDSYWTAPDPATKAKLATEIRLQSQRFGLSPLDRRRLQWEMPKSTTAKPAPRKAQKPDPRVKKV